MDDLAVGPRRSARTRDAEVAPPDPLRLADPVISRSSLTAGHSSVNVAPTPAPCRPSSHSTYVSELLMWPWKLRWGVMTRFPSFSGNGSPFTSV